MTNLEIINKCLLETQTQVESIKTMQEYGYYTEKLSKVRIKEEHETALQFIKTLYMYDIIDKELFNKTVESLNDLVY